jgi:PEGA domain-containing protein
MIAAAAFVLAVGSSPAFAQRGSGGGHAGGGGGHVVGGMSGGHAMGGRHGQGAGGGRPQGTPGSGPIGAPKPHSNPDAMKGDGHGRHFDDDGHHVNHGDHDRDFHPRVFYFEPFFWGWSYPYYPYYPYMDYQWYQDNSDLDPSYESFRPTYDSTSETENGGISLDVTPPDALVYVDNHYVGTASSFTTSQPLWLAAGSHRLELLATGSAPASLEVNVVAGQTIPYRVSLTSTSDR